MNRIHSPHGPIGEQLDLLASLGDDAIEVSSSPAMPMPMPMTCATGAETPGELPDAAALLSLLAEWVERGWLRSVDLVFARFLHEQAPQAHASVLLAAALASHQLGRGHVCLDLARTLEDSRFVLSLPPDGDLGEAMPRLPADLLGSVALAEWQAQLADSGLCASGDDPAQAPVANQEAGRPLVMTGGRLYLRRYWQYEQDVRQAIASRLAQGAALRAQTAPARIAQGLSALFAPAAPGDAAIDWQRAACALMTATAFGIVTGGPGTGKTTTVVRLLALLQSLAMTPADEHGWGPSTTASSSSRALRIRLAAPTGKAAARLQESITGAVRQLALTALPGGEAIRAQIPSDVTTLHRLLGSRPDSRRFRHHAGHPLSLDVLVIDEASMIDLEMMAAVLEALPPKARLVMLGDKDQLSSVEAGAVLGSLCARSAQGHILPETARWLAEAGGGAIPQELLDPAGRPLDQVVVMLRHSHRFHADSGIGQLAQAVNLGDRMTALQLLAHAPSRSTGSSMAGLGALVLPSGDEALLERLVVDGRDGSDGRDPVGSGYGHYLTLLQRSQPSLDAPQEAFDDWARSVIRAHSRFQVLCALRNGPWGVDGLNIRIAQMLARAGRLDRTSGWYPGRPVLVTRNDYGLGLMNGDIGITLALPHMDTAGISTGSGSALRWTLRVAFSDGGGADAKVRWILPSRLHDVQTVFAMTVHKSQGSEFDHAVLVLPERMSPVLTRELVYTGITRARTRFTLATPQRSGGSSPSVLDAAIARRVNRSGGLEGGWGVED